MWGTDPENLVEQHWGAHFMEKVWQLRVILTDLLGPEWENMCYSHTLGKHFISTYSIGEDVVCTSLELLG